MNRKSLFGRLAESTTALRTAERQEYFRAHLEPLEDRKMLVATVYFNDDWVNESNANTAPVFGDLVGHPSDFGGGVTGLTYGIDAFGTEVSTGSSADPFSDEMFEGIATVLDDGSFLVGAGTYAVSDILIDRPMSFIGDGQGVVTLVPEAASANTAAGNFPASTHSGIIIQMSALNLAKSGVTVTGVTLDGGSGTFSDLDYHYGVTTLFDSLGSATLHNGTPASLQWGTPGIHGTNETNPDISITDVTVQNVFKAGIVLSAKEDQAYDTDSGESLALNIFNNTVTNVGDVKDDTRIGILMQNLNDNQDGTTGNAVNNTISNVGVGIKSAGFGTVNFGSQNAANNGAQVALNFIDDADVYGLWVQDAREEGHNATTVTGGTSTGVGVFLDHSRADSLVGTRVTGYGTGILVQNSSFAQDITPYFSVGTLTGPGTGVAGSTGILVNNGGGDFESIFLVKATVEVTGFETGIKVDQEFVHADENLLKLDRLQLSGNGTDLVVGDNSRVIGNFGYGSFEDVSVTGTGILDPRQTNNFNFDGDGPDFWNGTSKSPGVDVTPDKADTQVAANITLNSGATFNPVITGETGAETTLWNWDNTVAYPGILAPPLDWVGSIQSPDNPYGALTNWGGQVFQNNGATLELGGTATNGNGLSFLFGGNFDNSANASIYVIQPVDLSQRTHFNLDLKLGAASQAELITFALGDNRANSESWEIPTSILNSTAFTTVKISLIAPSLELTDNTGDFDNGGTDDLGVSLGALGFYVFGGDQGVINGNQNIPLRFEADNLSFTSQKNSMLEVSGSIDLAGATLAGDVRSGFTPGSAEEFTIINKTSVGAVTGTFAGLAEGAQVSIDGNNFEISYTGGDGNDVVLTASSNVSTVVGRHLFYNNSKYDGNTPGIVAPIIGANNDDSDAIATDKSAYLPGGGLITSASVSAYSRGINGIAIDLQGTHGTLSLADFEFAMSEQGLTVNNTPSTWVAAPAPTAFSVIPDVPAVGTDRIEFIWADNVVENRYLEVTVKGNDAAGGSNTNTGLAATDFFYYGSRVGDDFLLTPPSTFNTTAGDEIDARNNPGFLQPLTNIYDYNKDSLVTAADQIFARNNAGFQFKINITGPPPPAPGGGDDDGAGSAVASALAASGSSSDGGSDGGGWVDTRLGSVSADSGSVAEAITQLAEGDSPGALGGSDGGEDDLDSLLDSLLADL